MRFGSLRLALPGFFLAASSLWNPLSAGDSQGKPIAEPSLTAKDRSHWAFQKPRHPAIPGVKDSAWVRTPIDAFVLQRLEQASLDPSPQT
jgi:hypothetical protein